MVIRLWAWLSADKSLREPTTNQCGILLDLMPVVNSGVNGSYYASGLIDINIPSYTMASMPVGIFVYDIERFPAQIPTGNSIKLLRGKFIVSPEVTSF